jgi:hypothetical protein
MTTDHDRRLAHKIVAEIAVRYGSGDKIHTMQRRKGTRIAADRSPTCGAPSAAPVQWPTHLDVQPARGCR